MVYTAKWGIMATGGIAKTFVKDMLKDGATRGAPDVDHDVVAVASSTSAERAKEFIKELSIPGAVAAYGNYHDLVADPKVDIVYVATPHGRHYEDVKLALNAGKHVLCEKAFTINEPQLVHLIKIAKEKKLFLMEAVWTRYFPAVIELQKLLFEDKILGDIIRVHADLGAPFDKKKFPTSHRIFNPELGGGALLDLGIYSLTWVFLIAFQDPRNQKTAPIVAATMLKHPETGVDEDTTIALSFPKSHVSATATTTVNAESNPAGFCFIQGEKGNITVQGYAYKPETYIISLNGQEPIKKVSVVPGRGMSMEADEAARCRRDGKLESDRLTLEESRILMAVMDKARADNDFKYPAHIEAYDA